MLRFASPRRYGAKIVPPSDPYAGFVKSLLHFEAANGSTVITDEIAGNTWSHGGGLLIQTAGALVGSSSAYLNGTGYTRCIDADGSRFSIGTNTDFCIEFTVKLDVSQVWGGAHLLMIGRAYYSQPIQVYAQASGRLVFYCAPNQVTTPINTVNLGQKHDIKVSRSGGFIRIHVDGVVRASVASTANNLGQVMQEICLACSVAGNYGENGLYDEFRLTIGSARDVGNYTPSLPFIYP